MKKFQVLFFFFSLEMVCLKKFWIYKWPINSLNAFSIRCEHLSTNLNLNKVSLFLIAWETWFFVKKLPHEQHQKQFDFMGCDLISWNSRRLCVQMNAWMHIIFSLLFCTGDKRKTLIFVDICVPSFAPSIRMSSIRSSRNHPMNTFFS